MIDTRRQFFGRVACTIGACLIGLAAAASQEFAHARISYVDGPVSIKGTLDDAWAYASANALLVEGDLVRAETSGLAECETSDASFIRIAAQSQLEIAGLPPDTFISSAQGSFYVQRLRASRGDFTFETPACLVDINTDTLVRVDILENGATTISVFDGTAVVSANGQGAVRARQGHRVFVDPGQLPSYPTRMNENVRDDFDIWNDWRMELLDYPAHALPPALTSYGPIIGLNDLAVEGEWIYIGGTPCWRPTHVRDFVPYRDGYWTYLPRTGYVWTGRYPFSYATTHYGRWHRSAQYGWVWFFDGQWAPAWAATVRMGNRFVWCPLDRDNKPARYGEDFFPVGSTYFSLSASTSCSSDELLNGPCRVRPYSPDPGHDGNPHQAEGWRIALEERFRDTTRTNGWLGSGREYTPHRIVRGPDTASPHSHPSEDRAGRRSSGRTSYTQPDRYHGTNVRTPIDVRSRDARPRDITYNEQPRGSTTTRVWTGPPRDVTYLPSPEERLRIGNPVGPLPDQPVMPGVPEEPDEPKAPEAPSTPGHTHEPRHYDRDNDRQHHNWQAGPNGDRDQDDRSSADAPTGWRHVFEDGDAGASSSLHRRR